MWSILKAIKKNLVLAIPITMVLGVAYGTFFPTAQLQATIMPLTILMIFPAMVTLKVKKVFSHCSVKAQSSIQLLNLIGIPLVGYILGKIFFVNNPELAVGLFLIAVLPTSAMTISWTTLAKGNGTIAVKSTVIGLVTGAALLPVYSSQFMGHHISISYTHMMAQLAKVIFIPFVLGIFTQWLLTKRLGQTVFQKQVQPKFPLISTLGVVAIIFVVMALKAQQIINQPASVLVVLLPLSIFYLVNYVLATVIGRLLLKSADAISLVYATAMRNLSVALAIALTAFGQQGIEMSLIIAVAYVVQVQSAAWYLRLWPGRKDKPADASGKTEVPIAAASTLH